MKWIAIVLAVVMLFSTVALLGKDRLFEKEETPTETVETNGAMDTGKDSTDLGEDTSGTVEPEPEPVETWTVVEGRYDDEDPTFACYENLTVGGIYLLDRSYLGEIDGETMEANGFEFQWGDCNLDDVAFSKYLLLQATAESANLMFESEELPVLYEYSLPDEIEWGTTVEAVGINQHIVEYNDYSLENDQLYLIKISFEDYSFYDCTLYFEETGYNVTYEYSFHCVELTEDYALYIGGGMNLSECGAFYYFYGDEEYDLTDCTFKMSACKVPFPAVAE